MHIYMYITYYCICNSHHQCDYTTSVMVIWHAKELGTNSWYYQIIIKYCILQVASFSQAVCYKDYNDEVMKKSEIGFNNCRNMKEDRTLISTNPIWFLSPHYTLL